MATSDKEPGLAESTNDDDVVEIGADALTPIEPPETPGGNKLHQLLARARSASSTSSEMDYDFAEEKTDMVTPEELNAALEPLPPAPESAPVQPASPDAAPTAPAPPEPSAEAPPAQQAAAPSPDASYTGPPPASASTSGIMPATPSTSGIMPAYSPAAPIPLAPSGEFGIVPDIGQSREGVRAYEPPSARRRRSIAVGVTVVVGLIAFVVISKLIVDQWVAPGRAVVWMAAGTILPTLLAGLLLAWPNAAGRASLRDVIVALVPALAMSGGAIFVATMWTQPTFRKAAVGFAQQSPSAMGAILEDPDTNVAVAGCKRFAPFHEQTEFRSLLFATLTVRPTIATKCMAELSEDARLAVATSLADRWSRELAVDDEGADVGRLCATAGGLSALPLERASVGARLLECTMTAPMTAAQGCCADSLNAMVPDNKQWPKFLREITAFVRTETTAAGVFAMAFHQKNLTAEQVKFAKDAQFQTPPVQLAALEGACGAVDDGRASVIRHMQAALEGQCAIEPSGVPTTLSMWREVCFMTLAELDADRTLPPNVTMCEMAQEMSVATAIETAKRLARFAHRKDIEGTFARQIDLGYVKVLDEISRAGETNGEIPSFVSKEDAENAQRDISQGDMTNSNFQFAAPGDDGFQAFMKAYREQKPWVNNQRQKEAVDQIRKQD